MLKRVEMDTHVTLFEQLAQEVGPVILVNTFHVEPEDAEALLEAWADLCDPPQGQARVHLRVQLGAGDA